MRAMQGPHKSSDHLVRVLTTDGQLRAAAADTTCLVREICALQQTDLTATVALGRFLTGAALLGCLLKGQQRLALMIEANGPLERLMVETDAAGHVCGKVKHPLTAVPPRDGRFDVAAAVGRAGFLHVVKDLGLKEPYRSMVQLQTSEIGEDLAWYLTHSEQVPSCVALGVELDSQGQVAAAGGYLIQALPPGDETQLGRLETHLRNFPPATSWLRRGTGPTELLQEVLLDRRFSVRQTTRLRFTCSCSRNQISKVLAGLGASELEAMAREQQGAEIRCEYCRKNYLYATDELLALASSEEDHSERF